MASIKILDGDGSSKYYQIVEDGSTTNPYQSVIPDFKLAHAITTIEDDYSDTVSIWEKKKTLIKFGKNDDLDTGVAETIWETGGNETLKTANDIDVIKSTNAGDTQEVTIEGHTISGSDLTFVAQTATLTGTSNVSLTTPLARVTRAYNNGSTAFAGDITIEDSGTSVHLTIKGTNGDNQSKKCATAISSQDYYIITKIAGGVIGSVSSTVEFQLQFKQIGKTWRSVYTFNSSNFTQLDLDPYIVIPKNSDVRIIGESNTNNTEAIASIHGYLAIVT